MSSLPGERDNVHPVEPSNPPDPPASKATWPRRHHLSTDTAGASPLTAPLSTLCPFSTPLPLLHPASKKLGKCHSSSAAPPPQPSVAPHCPLELGPQASQNRPSNPSASSPHCLPLSSACHPQLLLLFPTCLGLTLASKPLHKAIPSHGTPFPCLPVAQLRRLFAGRRLLLLSPQKCWLGAACGPGTGTWPPLEAAVLHRVGLG